MRLKLGRPSLSSYADRFDVPPAAGDFGVTFLGVASLLLDDGETAIMTDGFFSRPSLPRTAAAAPSRRTWAASTSRWTASASVAPGADSPPYSPCTRTSTT